MSTVQPKTRLIVLERSTVREMLPRYSRMALGTIPCEFAVRILFGAYYKGSDCDQDNA